MGLTKLVIRGARQHNLKNISVEIPRNSLTVITGLSGSGKSSLAFDTIYAEGQRRYVESLSAYARQFLDQMERPEVDVIEGLSPSIAIEQKTTTRSPRSTVGTITEIYDYLRVVYSSIGVPHCPNCGRAIARQSSEQIVQAVLSGELAREGDRIMVLAPIVRGRKGEYREEFDKMVRAGFTRARIDRVLYPLDEPPRLDRRKNHDIEIVVDRLLVKPGIAERLTQSLNTALKLARGIVTVSVVDGTEQVFSEKLACPECGISVPQLEPRSFSFNSPYGACPACNGLGSKYDFDPAKVIVDWSRPLFEGGLGPGSGSVYLKRTLEIAAVAHGFDLALSDFTALALSDARPAVDRVRQGLTLRQRRVAGRPLAEIAERLDFLLAVGLGYLSLDRSAATLSGGEAQRIRLATQIGSRLRGVLYVLDEPSIGLHARDNDRLLSSLEQLRNLGNTVLVVEHDEDTIRRADFVVDLGPGAGNAGGYLVPQGQPEQIAASAESLTGRYLSGAAVIPLPEKRRSPNGQAIQ